MDITLGQLLQFYGEAQVEIRLLKQELAKLQQGRVGEGKTSPTQEGDVKT